MERERTGGEQVRVLPGVQTSSKIVHDGRQLKAESLHTKRVCREHDDGQLSSKVETCQDSLSSQT